MNRSDHIKSYCPDGLILRAMEPRSGLNTTQKVTRGVIYILLLLYLFVGVSVISDKFMTAIEIITSSETISVRYNHLGEKETVRTRFWNRTVANLTLMAIGSSTPEILLATIECFTLNFEEGLLGIGTIIGSAAYNLFVIIAICMVVIPKGEARKIKELRVFFVTCVWSLFAYVWVYYVRSISTAGEISLAEGVVTLLFFPICVLTAFIADQRMLCFRFFKSGSTHSLHSDSSVDSFVYKEMSRRQIEEVRDFEKTRKAYLDLFKELRQKYPNKTNDEIEVLATEQLVNRVHKSRAFYRVQTTRKLFGGNIIRNLKETAVAQVSEIKKEEQQKNPPEMDTDDRQHIFFEPDNYVVMESCGTVVVKVRRHGNLTENITVDYTTEDGTAEDGFDYIGVSGTLTFLPGSHEQTIEIEIIDDDVFEQDEVFYVKLSNISYPGLLIGSDVANIVILDDDHCGILSIAKDIYVVSEASGICDIKVQRLSGARGRVILPYWTEDGSATQKKDYEPEIGELIFEDGEIEKFIVINLINEGDYEKNLIFYVNIGEPALDPDDEIYGLLKTASRKNVDQLSSDEKMALLARPKTGEIARTIVNIKESTEFRGMVDKIVNRTRQGFVGGRFTWKDQFFEAFATHEYFSTEMDDDREGKVDTPGFKDYFLHFLTLFWKIIFALIPPTGMFGGYLCFFTSIIIIGLVTAIISDAATLFGCSTGCPNFLTAICFIALGTSLPDTFASKMCALHDETADNSIGNVTGSNAVNVFLGLGIAWTMSAVYHHIQGTRFRVGSSGVGYPIKIYLIEALIVIAILMLRRFFGPGELGGPKFPKILCAIIFIGLWITFIVLSVLEYFDIA